MLPESRIDFSNLNAPEEITHKQKKHTHYISATFILLAFKSEQTPLRDPHNEFHKQSSSTNTKRDVWRYQHARASSRKWEERARTLCLWPQQQQQQNDVTMRAPGMTQIRFNYKEFASMVMRISEGHRGRPPLIWRGHLARTQK